MDAMGESLAVGMRQFRCANGVPAPSEISCDAKIRLIGSVKSSSKLDPTT
jgi:hypothetical protein